MEPRHLQDSAALALFCGLHHVVDQAALNELIERLAGERHWNGPDHQVRIVILAPLWHAGFAIEQAALVPWRIILHRDCTVEPFRDLEARIAPPVVEKRHGGT